MIEIYEGEFMASPAPLELSLHWCSHSCAYCFANLNAPNRTANVNQIIKFFAEFPQRQTLVAQLVKAGYPIVISNNVDPFANSNYKIAVPLMETLHALGIPVVFQTKGGRGAVEMCDLFAPSVWYVSISFWDDKRRAKIEPAAPPLQERFDLIARLKAKGHEVVIGMNPLVKEWLPPYDRDQLVKHLKSLGVWGCWTEPLHLNRNQFANLDDKAIEAMGYKVVQRAMKRPSADVLDYYHETREAIRAAGMEVFSIGRFERSDFFAPWRRLYEHTFPIQQDFVNWCHDHKQHGDLVTFDDWWRVLGSGFPPGTFANLKEYFNQSRKYFKAVVPKDMTYKDALTIIWQEPRAKRCPQDILCFAQATRGGAPVVDEHGLPVLAFVPEGQLEPMLEVA